jgi:hypothetical protein
MQPAIRLDFELSASQCCAMHSAAALFCQPGHCSEADSGAHPSRDAGGGLPPGKRQPASGSSPQMCAPTPLPPAACIITPAWAECTAAGWRVVTDTAVCMDTSPLEAAARKQGSHAEASMTTARRTSSSRRRWAPSASSTCPGKPADLQLLNGSVQNIRSQANGLDGTHSRASGLLLFACARAGCGTPVRWLHHGLLPVEQQRFHEDHLPATL